MRCTGIHSHWSVYDRYHGNQVTDNHHSPGACFQCTTTTTRHFDVHLSVRLSLRHNWLCHRGQRSPLFYNATACITVKQCFCAVSLFVLFLAWCRCSSCRDGVSHCTPPLLQKLFSSPSETGGFEIFRSTVSHSCNRASWFGN